MFPLETKTETVCGIQKTHGTVGDGSILENGDKVEILHLFFELLKHFHFMV